MSHEKIRKRILLPVAAALLVLLGMSIGNTYRLKQKRITDEVQASLSEVNQAFQAELDESAELMDGLIDFLKADANLQAAWLAKDREALLEHSEKVFQKMRSNYRVTHFYFHGLDQVCFLRVYHPSRYGDKVKRFTLTRAVRSGKPAQGMELGTLGTFTMRVVHPWRINGELAGYIELGIDVEGLAKHLKEILNAELIVAIEKPYLNRQSWEEGLKVLGRKGNWDEFEEFVVVESTMEEIPPALGERLAEHEDKTQEKFLFGVQHKDRKYHGGFVALLDAGGREVGEIVCLEDVTEVEAAMWDYMVTTAIAHLAIGAILLWFFYSFLGRVQANLLAARSELKRSNKQLKKETFDLRRTKKELGEEIEEHKQAEEALRLSEEKFSKAFNSSPDSIAITSVTSGRLLEVNEGFEKMFGYSRDEVLGKTTLELKLWQGDGDRDAMLEVIRDKGNAKDLEIHIRDKAGGIHDCLVSCETIDIEGEACLVSVTRDITERKRAEMKLVRQEKNLQAIFDSAPVGMLLIDENTVVTRINHVAAKLAGKSKSEMISVQPGEAFSCVHLSDSSQGCGHGPHCPSCSIRNIFEQTLHSGQSIHGVECQSTFLIGQEKLIKPWLEVSVEPLTLNGKKHAVVAINNVTERKQAEDSYRRFGEQLISLIEVTNELGTTDTFDELCRRAVELGQSRLGFDRLGMWFRGSEGDNSLVGSFGVDEKGNVRDERDKKMTLGADSPEMGVLRSNEPSVLLCGLGPVNHEGEMGGQIDQVFAGIWDGKEVIGYISIDNLTIKGPVTKQQCRVLRQFASSIGHLISQQRAEQKLQESNSKYKMLVENIPQRVFLKDRDSVYVSCNDNYARDLGIECQEILGKTDYDFYPDNLAQAYRASDRRILDSGEAEDSEERHVLQGQEMVIHLVKTPVRDDQGKIIGVLGVFGDISERKKAEQKLLATNQQLIASDQQFRAANLQLQEAITEREEKEESLRQAKEQAEQAEAKAREINKQLEASIEQANLMAEEALAADMTKSEFLANMSHEIRTPMTAILGYTDLLADPTLGGEERGDHLAVIRRNGEQLLMLINDILDLSKIESGKMGTELRSCSLVSIVADVVSMMQIRADQQGTLLCAEYTSELPETILTDGARLRQALVNLVGNAVKFTQQGMVSVMVSFLPAWNEKNPAVRIDVVDTGIGIKREALSRLFEPFVQADASTSRKYGGTGLGLAITHHVAELLDGELVAESTPGNGSVFSLTIPTGSLEGVKMLGFGNPCEAAASLRRSEETYKEAVMPVQNQVLEGKRILLAEDGPDNQRLISTVLSKAGAEVDLAENGLVAVERALAEPYDLVLMDMQMPEMDGYQATEKLRKNGFSGPIVALTAHALTGDRERCLRAGCTDYLSKPINRSVLINTILKHVGDGQVADEAGRTKEASQAVGESIQSEFADDADLAEIIDMFVSELPGKLTAMREALANGHHEELQRQAHQLKGAGGSYGYPQLTQVSKKVEGAAKIQDVEGAGVALGELSKLCEAVTNGHKREATSKEA